MPKILLVTFDWSTLTEMPYLLKQAGCQVDVLCPKDNEAIKNGYYDHWIDAGDSMATLITSLEKRANNDAYRYIMIGDDPILWAIYREKIAALWHLLPVKNVAALSILNKVGFAEHCRQHGIRSPEFRPIGCLAEVTHAVDALDFPLVLKTNYSNGGVGVRICKEAASLDAFIATHDFSEPLLAQRFIKGRQIGVEALFKNGKLLQYVCSEDIEPTLGPSTARRYFPNDDKIGDLVRQIGQSARLHGFANVSLLQEAESLNYYLIEADPRPNKWVPYARWFGCDFSRHFKTFLADGDDDELACSATVVAPEIDCWEVEHFASHFAKLFNAGQYIDTILHLLDFNRNTRYTAYDPVLLQFKMDALHQQIRDQLDAAVAAKAVVPANPRRRQADAKDVNKSGQAITTLTIDNQDYDLDSLSAEAKAQLQSLQFVDAELARLQAQGAVLQTARMAYSKALQAALPVLPVDDTIKLN